jgi:hypothetical protein
MIFDVLKQAGRVGATYGLPVPAVRILGTGAILAGP